MDAAKDINGTNVELDSRSLRIRPSGLFAPTQEFKLRDLVSVELIDAKLNRSITKTDRMSQLGGALIGGAVFGPLGALAGGVTGKTVTDDKSVSYTYLKICVNDRNTPVHHLNFGYQQNHRWYQLISAKIASLRDAEKHRSSQKPEEKLRREEHYQASVPRLKTDDSCRTGIQHTLSAADELTKLSILVEKGFLSKKEFIDQKKLILEKTGRRPSSTGSQSHLPGRTNQVSELDEELVRHVILITEDKFIPRDIEFFYNICRETIQAGANPNIRLREGDEVLTFDARVGYPLLHIAIAYSGDKEVAYRLSKFLVEQGADVNASYKGKRAIDLCRPSGKYPNNRLCSFLIESGERRITRNPIPNNLKSVAGENGDQQGAANSSVSKLDDELASNIIWLACEETPDNGELDDALLQSERLIAAGATPNLRISEDGDVTYAVNEDGGVPLLQTAIACAKDLEVAYKLARWLVDHGADCNATFEGERAIDMCSPGGQYPNEKLRLFLLETGAVES